MDDKTAQAEELSDDTDQDTVSDSAVESTVVENPRNMFDLSEEDDEVAMRAARKRAAIWGFGTGMAMLVVVALCLLLAILFSNSTS